MIGLSSRIFDPLGAIYLYLHQIGSRTFDDLYASSRRVQRYTTLDGGVSVIDQGYAVGDRSLSLEIVGGDKDLLETVARLVRGYGSLTLTTPDGAFLATPANFRNDGESIILDLLITGEA